MPSRRNFITATAGFCIYALLQESRASVPRRRLLPASRWIQQQDELARGLAGGKVSQLEWHDAVSRTDWRWKWISNRCRMSSAAPSLARGGNPFGHDPQKRFVSFLDGQGQVLQLRYAVALFQFDADSVITPHAHRHMASTHLVVEGKLRVRTFDRVRDENQSLVLRPVIDEIASVGHATAMTSARDNVHWFAPRSERAMTLDVIVDGLDKGPQRYEIQPVDPIGGIELPDGTLRAPLLSFERSAQVYKASL
ncbi:MAG: hypothetical protein QM706_07065 [Nitrospira sp.]